MAGGKIKYIILSFLLVNSIIASSQSTRLDYSEIQSVEDMKIFEQEWLEEISKDTLKDYLYSLNLKEESLYLLYYTKKNCPPCEENKLVLDSILSKNENMPIYSFYLKNDYADPFGINLGPHPRLVEILLNPRTPSIFIMHRSELCSIKSGGPGIKPKYSYHINRLQEKIDDCRKRFKYPIPPK